MVIQCAFAGPLAQRPLMVVLSPSYFTDSRCNNHGIAGARLTRGRIEKAAQQVRERTRSGKLSDPKLRVLGEHFWTTYPPRNYLRNSATLAGAVNLQNVFV